MTDLGDLFEGALTLDTTDLKMISNIKDNGNDSSSSGLNIKKIQNVKDAMATESKMRHFV